MELTRLIRRLACLALFVQGFGSAGVLAEPVVVYTADRDAERVFRVGGDGVGFVEHSERVPTPIAVAVDSDAGKVYWADFLLPKIHRSDIGGSNVETILDSGLAGIVAMKVEPEGKKLYFIDGIGNNARIMRSDLDGSNVETLVSDMEESRDLAIDSQADKIYWSSFDNPHQLFRANIDGTNTEVFLDVLGETSFRGLAIDVENRVLYFTSLFSSVNKLDLKKKKFELLTVTDAGRGIAIDFGAKKLYWTEANTCENVPFCEEYARIKRSNLKGQSIETIAAAPAQALVNPQQIALFYEDSGDGDDSDKKKSKCAKKKTKKAKKRCKKKKKRKKKKKK